MESDRLRRAVATGVTDSEIDRLLAYVSGIERSGCRIKFIRMPARCRRAWVGVAGYTGLPRDWPTFAGYPVRFYE